MYCLPRQIHTYREQNERRYERTPEWRHGTVVSQFGSRNVYDPIQYEKQHRNDGTHAQASLSYQCSQRRTYEEKYETSERLCETLENLHVGPTQIKVIHVVFTAVIRHIRGHVIGLVPRLFQCAYLSLPVLPSEIIVGMEVPLRRIEIGRVELTLESEIVSIHDFSVMLGIGLLGHHSQ